MEAWSLTGVFLATLNSMLALINARHNLRSMLPGAKIGLENEAVVVTLKESQLRVVSPLCYALFIDGQGNVGLSGITPDRYASESVTGWRPVEQRVGGSGV